MTALLAITALTTTGCATEPEFSVGDCVQIEQRLLDSNLVSASCAGSIGSMDPTQQIHKVDSIIDNTDGGCPMGTGFFPVEFVHEPDGVTYCLVMHHDY